MSLHTLSLSDASAAIASRDLSPVELTAAVLNQIQAVEDQVGAYTTVLWEKARQAAREAEDEIARGHYRGPLQGIPVGIKDNYDTAGVLTTASSLQWSDNIPGSDSAMVAQLRSLGAVVLGKTRMDEFAFGGSTPGTSNPWDLSRIPGGSSGGSAAAVAAHECLLAVGTDTGGSIRLPASFCGAVGLKPTYGLFDTRGTAALSWSLDHAGPITKTVADAQVFMRAFGHRHHADKPVASAQGLVIGVPTNHVNTRLQPGVESINRALLDSLANSGAILIDVELPFTDFYLPAEWGILIPESAAFHRQRMQKSPEKFSDEVRAFLEIGDMIAATDYITAVRARETIKSAWRDLYEQHQLDAIISPTVPVAAPGRGEDDIVWSDGTTEPLLPLLGNAASPANLTGLPALSVPCGLTDTGLPVGMQIVGRPYTEELVLQIGSLCEQLSAWDATRIPAGIR